MEGGGEEGAAVCAICCVIFCFVFSFLESFISDGSRGGGVAHTAPCVCIYDERTAAGGATRAG